MTQPSTLEKKQALQERLRDLGRVAVAFSGGVDSAFLTALAYRVLGREAVAVTVVSPLVPSNELDDARRLAQQIGVKHVLLEMNELLVDEFVSNPPDKCYICKAARFSRMFEWARDHQIPWLLDGSNADDLKDYRPGMKALAEIPSVRSPMLEAGLTKAEIRALSREEGLFTWDKPALACLASRIPYGETITEDKLRRIEAAEAFVGTILPPRSQFRVRQHGDLARIELDDETRPLDRGQMRRIHDELRHIGFRYVTLDLGGYRMGSLNEALPTLPRIG